MIFIALLSLAWSTPVPILEGENLTKFLQNSHRSVVFFLAGALHVDENGFDIGEFKNRIDIIESTRDEGVKYNCSAFPCIVPFSDGISLKSAAIPPHYASFSEWLTHIISIDTIQINTTEQAEILLNGNGSYIFAVDHYERPFNAPPGATVYLIPSILLKGEVSKGIYSYSPVAHMFTPLFYEKSVIVEPDLIKFGAKKFIAGFMIKKNLMQNSFRSEILMTLAKRFRHNFTFTLMSGPASKMLKRQARLELIPMPYFFIIDTTSTTPRRWIVQGANMDNHTYLAKLLSNVNSGKAPPTQISEQVVNEPSVVIYRKLCRNNFEEEVFDQSKDVVLLFKTPWCRRCRKMELALRQMASLLQNKNIRVYHYDATANDIPEVIENRLYGFPAVMMWPAARKNEEPIVYRGGAKLVDVMRFVAEHATTKFAMPDLETLETRLMEDKSTDEL